MVPQKALVPTPRPPRGSEQRSRGRLTVATATANEEERMRSVASFRRRTQRLKGHGAQDHKDKIAREIVLPEAITIQELASRMSERAVDVIKLLMRQGRMVTLTDALDADTAQLIAEEMGHSVKRVADSDVEEGLFDRPDEEGASVPRPPIVTIMGHVDHGKTSLLDAIRHANVVAGEAGGITQHIGAYQVIAPGGETITFIDTPGHAAFTAMRARGAKVTDIVVLVVAADDGVMPQTIEAIRHAKAARAPIIVAINKIDKPEANPQRVMQELLQHDVQVEAFGGDTLAVEVSATKQTNLDKLLEAIALQAELLDLVADPERSAEGTVIEARLDRGRGPVATVLVQRGTLRVGQLVVAGSHWGRVRALINEKGETLEAAGPSTPVEVLGFSGAPEAGDRVAVVETEARAREITEYRERQRREKAAARGPAARTSLSDMMSNLKAAGRKELPIVVKGDVQGSVEAITAAVEKLGNEEVVARVIHGGVGGVTESDVTLAEASKAVIVGFNVRAHKEARDLAEQAGIEIRYYNIIYNLVDDVKAALSGMLSPTLRETMLGNAQILEIFHISKVGRGGGLPGYRRRRAARRTCAAHPRQCRRARRQAFDAQALQGRGQPGAGRSGMRHGVRELPGHARRRRDRVLQRRGDPPHALTRTQLTTTALPGFMARPGSVRLGSPPARVFSRAARPVNLMPRSVSKPSTTHRAERVGELIRHAIAEILARGEIVDDMLDRHPLTIPAIRMSSDLRLATVSVMPLGGQGGIAVVDALNRHKKELRALVAHKINLKFAPDLRFTLDSSFDAQARIDALLKSPQVARDLARAANGKDEP